MKRLASRTVFYFSFFLLLAGCLVFWLDTVFLRSVPSFGTIFAARGPEVPQRTKYLLSCSSTGNLSQITCPRTYPDEHKLRKLNTRSCPEYFRWIHEDLRPWKRSGITREMLERGKVHADFRLVVVGGKVYTEKYMDTFQTRDVFTIWGILQLLRLYPGGVPDSDLMFSCGDRPRVLKRDYLESNVTSLPPPPMFQYCEEAGSLGVVFPDWTFWGWAETNVRPWKGLLEDLKEANRRTKWKDRVPYAFWRGNPYVSTDRVEFMRCNASENQDWNARLYKQKWDKEAKEGFKYSKLEDQCTHRYKIYIEGWGWSVSEKYILACDSTVLLIKPRYYDFFSRSMVPLQHYWPIRAANNCRDIKFAVEWGNNHPNEAEAIGKAGSKFIQENLKMENVYDYMFYSLREYAKLLKYKPTIPEGAMEVCLDKVACSWKGVWNKFMVESMVKSASDSSPCTMPPPYKTKELLTFLKTKEYFSRQVEKWQDEYWGKETTYDQ